MFQGIEYNTIELRKGTYSKKDLQKLKRKFKKFGRICISCPSCEKKGKILIPYNLIENKSNLLKVVVTNNYICKHSFTLWIDHQLQVRSKELNDYIVR